MIKVLKYILCSIVLFSLYFYLTSKYKLVISLILFLITLYLSINIKKNNIKEYKETYIFSFIFSFINVLGKYVYLYNDLFLAFKGFNLLKTIIEIIGISYLTSNIFNYLFFYLIKYKDKKIINRYKIFDNKRLFFILWILIFISWMFCFLSYYPGIFSYDMQLQTAFLYIEPNIFSKYHPPLHTYFWKFCLFISSYIKIEALAIYSLLQMFIMSGISAYLVTFIIKREKSNFINILTILFFTLNPIVAIISLLPTKDVLFSGGVSLFVLEVYKFLENKEDYFKKIYNYIKLIIITTILCLLRNNAIYIVVIFTIILCLCNKGKVFELLCVFLCSIAIYEFTDNYVYVKLGIAEGFEREKIPVLLQQISLVDYLHHYKLDENTKEEINRYWYRDDSNKEYYNYRFGDVAKYYFYEDEYIKDKKGFYKLYFKLLKKYPKDYINAFLNLNIPSWYIDSKTIDPYSKRAYIEDNIYESYHYVVKRKSKLKKGLKFYSNIANYSYIENIPIINKICSIYMPIWFLLFTMLVCIIKKMKDKILVLLPPLLLWFTYLLGPVSCFRYMIPIFMLYPLFIFIIFSNRGDTNG